MSLALDAILVSDDLDEFEVESSSSDELSRQLDDPVEDVSEIIGMVNENEAEVGMVAAAASAEAAAAAADFLGLPNRPLNEPVESLLLVVPLAVEVRKLPLLLLPLLDDDDDDDIFLLFQERHDHDGCCQSRH